MVGTPPPLRFVGLAHPTFLEGVLIRDNALWHGRRRMSPRLEMPVIPRALVENSRRRLFQRFPEALEADITHHDRDFICRAVRHQICEKADRICQRTLGRFEPNNSRCDFKQIAVLGERLHVLASRSLNAFSFGRFQKSVAAAALPRSSRTDLDRSASVKSS